jgi:hypothetical protein
VCVSGKIELLRPDGGDNEPKQNGYQGHAKRVRGGTHINEGQGMTNDK